MRPICIVNPYSAGGRTGSQWPRLRYQLEREIGLTDCYLTGAPGDAVSIARDAVSGGAESLVIVGGDGTVNEVVNGVMQASERSLKLTLGILPAGTGRDLARALKIPFSQEKAIKLLAQGQAKSVDVGKIDCLNGELDTKSQRYFVNIASFGIEGLVDKRLEKSSRVLGGKLTYLYAALAESLRFRPVSVLLRFNGTELIREIYSVIIANGRFFGGGMDIAPASTVYDGLFDVVLIKHAPLWRLAMLIRRLYNGTIYGSSLVERYTTTKLEAQSLNGSALLGVDGEAFGMLPSRFLLLPGALRIIQGD